MKCPRCGHEMTLDNHRKYALNMCYECGYIEGRFNEAELKENNFQHLKKLDFNEATAFIANGLGLEDAAVADWLDNVNLEPLQK